MVWLNGRRLVRNTTGKLVTRSLGMMYVGKFPDGEWTQNMNINES